MKFEVTIKETSRELTKKERIKMKDTSNAIKLDEATKDSAIIIKPVAYAILEVHNEKADPQDYEQYIVQAEDGNCYFTGSENFFQTFYSIFSEMEGEEEDWELKVYRAPSKNYVGRDFITCAIV